MRLVMPKSKVWKKSIGAISNIIDEATFTFSPEGVEMEAMDPSRVAMVYFHIYPTAFEEYSIDETKSIGLDLVEFDKIFSRAGKEDKVILEASEGKDRLNLTFAGASTRRFSVPIIDTGEEEIPSPDLDFTARGEVQASVIKDGLKDTSLISDNVTINLSDNGIKMMSESDTGSAETEVPREKDIVQDFEVEESSQAMYNTEYLSNIMKAASSGDFITVQAGEDIPIKLDFPILEDKAELQFVLAPRVESE